MKKFQEDKIKGINRLRDGKICVLWVKYNKSAKELSEIYKLTERRIQQILRKNHAFVPIDKEWEKKKRIKWIENQINKREDKGELSRKDLADLYEQHRKEIEGDKPLIDNSINTTYQKVKVIIDDNSRISSALKSRINPKRPKQV